jgi:hypothetical protein
LSKFVVIEGEGDPCPRCGHTTQIREHEKITGKELCRPFYYSRWFNCMNLDCRTTLIMPKRFMVWNEAISRQRAIRRSKREATEKAAQKLGGTVIWDDTVSTVDLPITPR